MECRTPSWFLLLHKLATFLFTKTVYNLKEILDLEFLYNSLLYIIDLCIIKY